MSQLAEGGRIVVDLRSESSSGLVVLDKTDLDHVSGRFVGRPGQFMWMRPDQDYPFRDPRLAAAVPARDDRTTVRDVAIHPDELDQSGLRTLIGIALPEVEMDPTRVRSPRRRRIVGETHRQRRHSHPGRAAAPVGSD